MYRQQNRNARNRFSSNRRKVQKIDASLFVRKATQETPQETQPVTHQFSDFLIGELLLRNIQAKGYQSPTPIQDKVIPEILAGKDVVGVANTGTGKTAAFLIPMINKILFNRSQRVLIIAPTRELALQIQEECRSFAKDLGIFTMLAIGGLSMHNQAAVLKKDPHFVIGTPGRMKEFVQTGKLNLSGFQNAILDEVDRMLDMGFINDIKFLISKMPANRQSLFFSATVPPEVTPLMHSFLRNPVTITVKTQDTAETIDQDVIKIRGRNKIDVLCDLLSQEGYSRVLVFGRTKWGMEKLSKILLQRGLRVAAIHGNKSQGQRQRALDMFKRGEIQALLATDVASRGIDIDNVTHVINYDQPATYDDYVHRIGRTGRMHNKGVAITFVD